MQWLGLYHTFEGDSCDGDGDYVSDTPLQSMQTDGCPVSQDSCPGREGQDNIHNVSELDIGTSYLFRYNFVADLLMSSIWTTPTIAV